MGLIIPDNLPDTIKDVTDDILKEIIFCEKTGKVYKCQNQVSIQFYSKELIKDLIKNGLCRNKT